MKDKFTCYIVDDEPLALEIMEEYIKKVSFLELRGSFMSPLDASRKMKEDPPDLIFLDINMPDLDGLSFITLLNPRPIIILTTAYDQYAVKAFELEVKDYLLKPISFERFYKAVLRLFQSQIPQEPQARVKATSELLAEKDFIFIKVGHRIQKIAISDILLIQGMKDYLKIHTIKGDFLTLMNFAQLEELINNQKFFRVHKSFMVAIDKIEHVEKNRIKIGQHLVPISEKYNESFFNSLKGLK